eukprot:CAMPEP_0113527352 /NCGR_PEP_ID=MMETSP0015_2-20120614/1250_1 /TAXON_ID=2838 /ORGANISM="Odontella" /LENGTH=50 /DNA_ID=CAMNT_0000425781 /DNA_START=26 /DNA_END=181 /DNA_ORIENTATION=- /assembly_acc=CAM_ASM_000160
MSARASGGRTVRLTGPTLRWIWRAPAPAAQNESSNILKSEQGVNTATMIL